MTPLNACNVVFKKSILVTKLRWQPFETLSNDGKHPKLQQCSDPQGIDHTNIERNQLLNVFYKRISHFLDVRPLQGIPQCFIPPQPGVSRRLSSPAVWTFFSPRPIWLLGAVWRRTSSIGRKSTHLFRSIETNHHDHDGGTNYQLRSYPWVRTLSCHVRLYYPCTKLVSQTARARILGALRSIIAAEMEQTIQLTDNNENLMRLPLCYAKRRNTTK